MLRGRAAQTACAAGDSGSSAMLRSEASAQAGSWSQLDGPAPRRQQQRVLQPTPNGRERARHRPSAAPPLDLSTQRRSQQREPQTETDSGGGGRGRGWGGAPPSGGGGGSWRPSADGDDDMDAYSSNPFRRTLVSLQSRRQTEPHFLARLVAVALLDVGAVLLANYAARRRQFAHELDAVITQAVISALNTIVLGLLLPPQHKQVIRVMSVQDGGLRAGLSVLPAHVFASNPALSAFSLTQRIASLLVFGAEFGAVGFACGVLGSAVVKRAYPPQAANTASSYQQSVMDLGGKWLLFMAVQGNIRHQMLRCCQRTLLPLAPTGAAEACVNAALHAASHVVGARQWLAFGES